MKRSNIKCVLAVIGIITISTIGFSVSDAGSNDVSEAEVTESATSSVVEVSTTSPKIVDTVSKKSVSASSKIYTSMTTQKKVEQVTESVTTKKPVVSAETKTEKKIEPTTQKKVAEKKTESKKPITEKATESTEKKHVTSDVKKHDPVEPVQEEINDIEDAKINEELRTSDGQKIVAELESETQKEEDKESCKSEFGYTLQYSAVYNVTTGHLTRSNGSIRYNGHRETWYSTNETAGKNTAVSIPGKHVADDGTIRDADGYVCVASSDLRFYSTVMTSVGPGKVYDCGCSHGTIDVYTNW